MELVKSSKETIVYYKPKCCFRWSLYIDEILQHIHSRTLYTIITDIHSNNMTVEKLEDKLLKKIPVKKAVGARLLPEPISLQHCLPKGSGG